MQVDQSKYDEIAKLIHSDQSPVGIDAKKTHVLILQTLDEIKQRLTKIENQLAEQNTVDS